MGSLFADFGLNPLMGRVFGLLLASEEALSLSRIAAELEVSKATVSILIRQLESFGYCQKLPTKGNREHFYLLRENYLSFSYGKRISREMSQLDIIRELGDAERDAPAFIRARIE
jgi:DNA-binding transcriptional regulator GbsR (MarR family)